MSKKTCRNCLFEDGCPSTHPCRHYAPVEEDSEDASGIIEVGRKLFRREWEAYLEDAGASDF